MEGLRINNNDTKAKFDRLMRKQIEELSGVTEANHSPLNSARHNPLGVNLPLFKNKSIGDQLEDTGRFRAPKIPDLNPLNLTIDQIRAKTDDELLKLLSGEDHSGMVSPSVVQLISSELLSRKIERSAIPHWTVTPTFIVACVAALFAAISIVLTIYFSVYYKDKDNSKHANQGYAVEKNSNP